MEQDTERAVREIANYPVMRDEAQALLPSLKTVATHPAGPEGVKTVVGRRFAVFTQPERSDAEWAMWWADYVDVLADVPEPALEAGMKIWLRNPANEFLPKPAQLRQLAMQTENYATRAYERAKRAVEYEPPKTYDQRPIPTVQTRAMGQGPSQADKDRVKAWAAEFIAAQPEKPKHEIQPNYGAVDASGLTQAMRDALARQRGELA